ncbi:MAG: DUF3343 domain-containing protein [Synergistaceae bacterium]|nr:DUF3343 domain-containing protein [Synergistaceae bacterium]
MECMATFDTVHMALFFEKSCRSVGLKVKIVPVPREISSSCGFACSYPCEEEENIKSIANEKEIEVSNYHRL